MDLARQKLMASTTAIVIGTSIVRSTPGSAQHCPQVGRRGCSPPNGTSRNQPLSQPSNTLPHLPTNLADARPGPAGGNRPSYLPHGLKKARRTLPREDL